jgi:predicted NAD/FAD-binding protein
MGAAIWSTAVEDVGDHPATAFIRFFQSHGLLKITDRPQWRTVVGGSREYVRRIAEPLAGRIRLGSGAAAIQATGSGVLVRDRSGAVQRFDHVVVAAHADQALALIENPTVQERRLLGAFRYARNDAVFHSDASLMPRRRRAWSSWNYLCRPDDDGGAAVCVTYWMNRLQGLDPGRDFFVTLNPIREPRADSVHRRLVYDHPVYDTAALAAQAELWRLQGQRGIWFCGSYFGAGFHEDALQSALAVAEAVGGVRRPWSVPDESGRIPLPARPPAPELVA